MLCDFIEEIFRKEKLVINQNQLAKYLSYQKYFSFELFEWEKFCFALHNCVYRENGTLRFPILFIYVGRGAGKNGYLSFEDFCLLTPTNGIQNYDIDIFATAEEQADFIVEQIKVIRKVAPQMPGIAFFSSKAHPEVLKKADEACRKYFLENQ